MKTSESKVQRLITAFNKGKTPVQAAKLVGVDPKTAHRYHTQWSAALDAAREARQATTSPAEPVQTTASARRVAREDRQREANEALRLKKIETMDEWHKRIDAKRQIEAVRTHIHDGIMVVSFNIHEPLENVFGGIGRALLAKAMRPERPEPKCTCPPGTFDVVGYHVTGCPATPADHLRRQRDALNGETSRKQVLAEMANDAQKMGLY